MKGFESFMVEQFDSLKELMALYYEWTFLAFGIFFLIAAWKDWNWVFDPPYNPIKNPVGFYFGRKAFRFTWFVTGVLVIVLCCGLIYYKEFLKV